MPSGSLHRAYPLASVVAAHMRSRKLCAARGSRRRSRCAWTAPSTGLLQSTPDAAHQRDAEEENVCPNGTL